MKQATGELEQRERRRGRDLLVLLALIIIGMVIISDWGDTSTTTVRGTVEEPEPFRTITYRLTGTATSAALTMSNGGGNTEQVDKAKVPLELPFESRNPYLHLYFSAQNNDETGNLLCELVIDGTVVETSHARGAYAICTVSGLLGEY